MTEHSLRHESLQRQYNGPRELSSTAYGDKAAQPYPAAKRQLGITHSGICSRICLLLALLLCAISIQAMELRPELIQAINEENYTVAIKELRQLAGKQPDDAQVKHFLARAYWLDGQLKAAEETIEQVLALRENHRDDYYLAGRIYAERVQSVGFFKKLSYAKKIRKAFLKTTELDPDFVKAQLALVRYYLAAPGIAGGSRDKAEAIIARLRDKQPAEALRAESMLALDDEDIDRAVKLLTQVLDLQPEDINALYMLAILHINQEQFDLAMPLLRRALSIAEATDIDRRQQQRGSLYQMGKTASISGRWLDEGRMALERYLQLEKHKGLPPPAWAYFRLGLIHRHLRQEEQAQKYFVLAKQEDLDDDTLEDLLDEQEEQTSSS